MLDESPLSLSLSLSACVDQRMLFDRMPHVLRKADARRISAAAAAAATLRTLHSLFAARSKLGLR